jgi:hypothetical protein
METKIKIISLFLLLCLGTCITPQKASAQGVSVGFQVFYDELSPYGTWVYSSDYGYVWLPDVAPGFTPYATNGYWVFTDEGWTWVSYYSWGWAPFHYGRWYIDATYGPMWVPDYEWGPGWVTWRRSGDYYGWAPIGPGVSISVAYGNGYNVPYDQWTFVRDRDFGRTNINNYYVNSSNNVTIINNSTVINNTQVDKSRNVTYNAGPDRIEVEKHVGKTITPVAIKESSTPGQNLSKNQLQIYRPQVQKNISTGPKPAPSKVESLQNVKTSAQRAAEAPPQKVNQPAKRQPSQQQKADQPAKQQPSQRQKSVPPAKQQPSQKQHDVQPAKQQPSQKQHDVQPAKQQPSKKQHDVQPAKQQPSQQQQMDQPAKQQPSQQQKTDQPAKQQPSQQQQMDQPAKQKPSQRQQAKPPKKVEREKQSKQAKPPKNMGGKK